MIDLDFDIKEVKKLLKDFPLDDKIIRASHNAAIIKTGNYLHRIAMRTVSEELKLSVTMLKNRIKKYRMPAVGGMARMKLFFGLNAIPMSQLAPKQQSGGVKAGPAFAPGAFMAKLKKGSSVTGVYKRKGKARLPVPDVAFWGHYERRDDKTPMPAVFIQVTDFENTDQSISDGRMQLMMNVNIRIMDAFHKENARMNMRKTALKIAEACHDNQFGLSITPAEIRSIERDVFDKNYGIYDVMVIEFVQSGIFGDLQEEDEFLPTKVLTSFAPDIGAAHEEGYSEIPHE